MGFMKPQIVFGKWHAIDTNCGITFLPSDVMGPMTDDWFDSNGDVTEEKERELLSYVEGNKLYSVEEITGYGARFSAPGYMDATQWCVLESEVAAKEHLIDFLDCDDDDYEEQVLTIRGE